MNRGSHHAHNDRAAPGSICWPDASPWRPGHRLNMGLFARPLEMVHHAKPGVTCLNVK
jgi:hypothetical protein